MTQEKTIESWQAVVSPTDPNKPRQDMTWEPNAYVPPECQCLVIQGMFGDGFYITTSAVRSIEGDTVVTQSGSRYRLANKRAVWTRDIAEVLEEHPHLAKSIEVNLLGTVDPPTRRTPNVRRSGKERRGRTTWKPEAK